MAVKREILRMRTFDRSQQFMEITNLEDMATVDDPVRAIWAFVERLDLSGYYNNIKSRIGVAGSPSYDPRVQIALWIYAYSQGIGSAREIEDLSKSHRSWRWLCGDRPINYHTLSDFRVDYKKELDELFTNSLGILSAEGLITMERITQDGTKIRANAGVDTFRSEKRLNKYLEIARDQVELLSDPKGEPTITARKQKAAQRAATERCQRLERALKEYKGLNEKKHVKKEIRVSTTDPESRIMKQGNGGYNPSYNAQIAVDAANKIIVGKHTTANSRDSEELKPMLEKVKEGIGRYPEQVIVDGDYNTYSNVVSSHQNGIDLIAGERDNNNVSKRQYQKRGIAKRFQSEAFKHDQSSRSMICPEGKVLKFDGTEELPGRTNFRYRANPEDCSRCPSKSQCCPRALEKGRSVFRKEYQEGVIAFREKMKTDRAKAAYRKRGENAEFINACFKERFGLRQFRLRGVLKADIEVTFAALAYNIMRWFRLRWYPALI